MIDTIESRESNKTETENKKHGLSESELRTNQYEYKKEHKEKK